MSGDDGRRTGGGRYSDVRRTAEGGPPKKDDAPPTPNESRPALMIHVQVLQERGDKICLWLQDVETALRKTWDHDEANAMKALREHLAHRNRELEAREDDGAVVKRRAVFFESCSYVSALLQDWRHLKPPGLA